MERRRDADAARKAAWKDARLMGPGGKTQFQAQAIATLTAAIGPLSLEIEGTKETCLAGPVPGADLKLYLYADEAQVHGNKHHFIAEQWHYDSPEALIAALVHFLRERAQPD